MAYASNSDGAETPIYGVVLQLAVRHAIGNAVARLVTSALLGRGYLPPTLGLGSSEYERLLQLHFRTTELRAALRCGPELGEGTQQELATAIQHAEVRTLLLQGRAEEVGQIEDLLLRHAHDESSRLLSRVVACGCVGGSHLWEDLGLVDRQQLRQLLSQSFPTLVAQNVYDMRWKRFFYRRLCEAGGDYICRAPSCDQCRSYAECYAIDDSKS